VSFTYSGPCCNSPFLESPVSLSHPTTNQGSHKSSNSRPSPSVLNLTPSVLDHHIYHAYTGPSTRLRRPAQHLFLNQCPGLVVGVMPSSSRRTPARGRRTNIYTASNITPGISRKGRREEVVGKARERKNEIRKSVFAGRSLAGGHGKKGETNVLPGAAGCR